MSEFIRCTSTMVLGRENAIVFHRYHDKNEVVASCLTRNDYKLRFIPLKKVNWDYVTITLY